MEQILMMFSVPKWMTTIKLLHVTKPRDFWMWSSDKYEVRLLDFQILWYKIGVTDHTQVTTQFSSD